MKALPQETRDKYEALYNKYCRLMKYIALKNLSNETLAEDAVQNAFIKLFRYCEKIDDLDSAKTRMLISVVTESESKDLLLKEKKYALRERKASLLDGESMDVSNAFIENSEVDERLSKLPEKYRTVLMLKTYYCFSDKEIAFLLNITNSNVRKRLQRARQFFAEKEM